MNISSTIKFLGEYFFIWSLPLSTILINFAKQRDIFEVNVLIALAIGIIINTAWEYVNLLLQKKEYHKNFL